MKFAAENIHVLDPRIILRRWPDLFKPRSCVLLALLDIHFVGLVGSFRYGGFFVCFFISSYASKHIEVKSFCPLSG